MLELGSWMTNVDRALLLSEWSSEYDCPVCGACEHDADGVVVGRHGVNCVMDLALAERGFHTQEDRNRAREFIWRNRVEVANTLPPPKERS